MSEESASRAAVAQSEQDHASAAAETHARNTRWGLAAFPFAVGLWLLYGFVPAPFLALLIAAIPVVGALVYGAHLLLARNRVLAGITSFGAALWTFSLVLSMAGPVFTGLTALLALLPVVFAMPVVSRGQLVWFFGIAIGVAGIGSALASGEAIFSVAPISQAGIRWVAIVAAPGLMAAICWTIWYENGWLRAALGRMAEANSRLQESERSLERKVAERTAEVAVARDAALEANRAKSAFLANMSHELRTPLNAILGYSELLKEEAEEIGQPQLIPDLDRINSSGRYLLELINGVLDLSKIEAGKMDVYLESFDVAEVVRGVAGTIAPLVRKNSNSLELADLEGLGTMHSDVTKLRQVLYNVLSNASKFTSRGTIRFEVARITLRDTEWLRFVISDSGIGMTPEQLTHIFEEFSQAESSTTRDFGGTGLGLPIAKRFCELLGGSISATAEAGVGSVFEVRLPAATPSNAATAEEIAGGVSANSQPNPPSTTAMKSRVGSVLVVDDDAAARDLLCRHLTQGGIDVVTASNGEDALRLARENPPDVITLDVFMPGTDGWDVLTQLKADSELSRIPVVLITVSEDKNLGFALGASEYLTKPVDWKRLDEVLSRFGGGESSSLALVVDDDPQARDILRRGLERAGWTVAEAENGRVALERVAEHPPMLILLDLMMPEVDGFEFVTALHKSAVWRSIPIIVISAKVLTPAERERLEGNVSSIFRKGSYEPSDLLDEIRRLVAAADAT